MKEIHLFIATSLDGFIAREDGSLDWLVNIPNPSQTDHGYNEMIENTDVIVMGRKTYMKFWALALNGLTKTAKPLW